MFYKDDFDQLPDHMKHRFVLFEPLNEVRTGDGKCDFTWEREWRMLGSIDLRRPSSYQIIVPSLTLGDQLKKDAEEESFMISDDCANSEVPVINYEDLCHDTCDTHQPDCPEPIFVDQGWIICMDNSC